MSVNKLIMSNKYPDFVAAVKNLGFDVITSQKIDCFPYSEQTHADMQALKINNSLFLLKECTKISSDINDYEGEIIKCTNDAGCKYPHNILLNFLYMNNTLYGKTDYADNSVLEYCKKNKIKLVDVKQGYCKCSTAVLSETAAITSDKTISKALKGNGAEVLEISSGNILLDGCEYGFIGGAGGKINADTYVFFGNIRKHPDYQKIKNFFDLHNIKIISLCSNAALTDIGGIVKI